MRPGRIALLCLGAGLAAVAGSPGAREQFNLRLSQLGFAITHRMGALGKEPPAE